MDEALKTPAAPGAASMEAMHAGTGIAGLDDILSGGLTRHRLYLIEGAPGCGKTTLALQYLMEGARRGESVLYVTLSETEEELRAVAASHGWDLAGVTIRELVPPERALQPAEQYTLFHPAEVELGETIHAILDEVERLRPARVAFDSLSELRMLAGTSLRYRRQLLAMKQFFRGRRSTVLLLEDLISHERDLQVQSIVHGVLQLEQLMPEYGAQRRRLRILKMRGRTYRGGHHDYILRKGGMEVFPRLVASEHAYHERPDRISSGIAGLDRLLGGGLERGTSALLVGAPGTGKSTLAALYAMDACRRGMGSALFLFDESVETLVGRMEGLGYDMGAALASGRMKARRVDPAELTPGQFAHAIRDAVGREAAGLIVIDSLNGYLNAMPGERLLTIHLHELLTYLGQQGAVTLMVGAQQGVIGTQMSLPVDASYLADTVILMRYFEAHGEVRQAVSVVKKRAGEHERTIREFRMGREGIHVGEPLSQYRGVLTGVPFYEGTAEPAPYPAR